MPWRKEVSAYCTWISEIMLQQTRVETVIPYYLRFIEEIPDVKTLAFIEEERLFKLWEGLGYYSRCRNLKKAAQILLKEREGVLPDSYENWLKLPGIGPYTAGAIASICFNEPVPAVDGNVLRVVARLHGIKDPVDRTPVKKDITRLTVAMMDQFRPGDYNQALMELGATVCTPGSQPRCGDCPWSNSCLSRKNRWIQEIPNKKKQKERRIEKKTVFLIIYNNSVVVQKREETGLLAGMWELPNHAGHWSPSRVLRWFRDMGLKVQTLESLGKGIHRFSHVEWQMIGYRVDLDMPQTVDGWHWVTLEDLEHSYAIPSAFALFRKELDPKIKSAE